MSLFNFLVILSSEYFELVRRKRRFGFGGVREIGRHPGLMYVAGFEVYAIGGEKWTRKREQIGDRLSKTSQSSEAPASSVIAPARILNYNKFQSSSFNKNKIRTAVFLKTSVYHVTFTVDFGWLLTKTSIYLTLFGQLEPQIFALFHSTMSNQPPPALVSAAMQTNRSTTVSETSAPSARSTPGPSAGPSGEGAPAGGIQRMKFKPKVPIRRVKT